MTLISTITFDGFKAFQDKLTKEARNHNHLSAAVQTCMSVMYNEFSDSIVLTRFFATLPFDSLPESKGKFVQDLASSVGISDLLNDKTPVLTLLGSAGKESDWNDCSKSQGHIGIPLLSAAFIDSIPMMSRLLEQLGTGLDWIDSNDADIVTRISGRISGVAYIQDARNETDSKGRKVISAQDFVHDYGVRTVFGIGGGYLGSPVMFVNIIFSRERIEKEIVERFSLQANRLKTATMKLVAANRIFA